MDEFFEIDEDIEGDMAEVHGNRTHNLAISHEFLFCPLPSLSLRCYIVIWVWGRWVLSFLFLKVPGKSGTMLGRLMRWLNWCVGKDELSWGTIQGIYRPKTYGASRSFVHHLLSEQIYREEY